jgi:ADP-dependent NAD(P)H-hydrate dehydratase
VVVYPHQKEWERLSGIPIEEQTYERNLEAVERIGATVVFEVSTY